MRAVIHILFCAAVLAGCSSRAPDAPEPASRASRFTNLLFLGTASPTPAPGSTPLPDYTCPPVEVLAGTASYTVGNSSDPFNVKYQASLGELARECVPSGDNIGIKVGVSGRLMAGPKGTSGTSIAVPVRIAVINPEGKAVVSRLARVTVTLPPGQSGHDFVHVEDVGSIPLDAGKLRGWKIAVGFDGGAKAAR
jgi:hypothetical protein